MCGLNNCPDLSWHIHANDSFTFFSSPDFSFKLHRFTPSNIYRTSVFRDSTGISNSLPPQAAPAPVVFIHCWHPHNCLGFSLLLTSHIRSVSKSTDDTKYVLILLVLLFLTRATLICLSCWGYWTSTLNGFLALGFSLRLPTPLFSSLPTYPPRLLEISI